MFFFSQTHIGMWRDGQLVMNVSHTIGSGDFSASTPFYLLRDTNEVNRWLGDVDEFAVYKGLLSQAEIVDHYNNGAGKYYASATETPAVAQAPVSDYKTVSYSPPPTTLMGADQMPLMQTSTIASYTYDGDGRQVKAVVGGVTTYYVGAHYQVDNGVVTKYYFAGAQRVAMRKNRTLSYLLADHLGSTSLTTNTSGAIVSELRYKAWGETRYSSGTTPTSYKYTGQREEPGIGLYFYNARWYDPYLNHFTQPDTIVPDPNHSQDWDRYAYARNNPVRYVDPSGHSTECTWDSACTYGQRLSPETVAEKYNVTFGGNWTEEHKWAVVQGVIRTAYRFAKELGTKATDAFKSAYGLNDGDTFFFEWDENCWGCRADPVGCDAGTTRGDACVSAFGYTNTENWIEFASMSDVEVPLRNINNVIHELGHAFNLRLGRGPENALAVRGDLLVNGTGFYGYPGNLTWEQSTGTNGSETFADQVLGWVYGKWNENDYLGPVRAEFMNQMNGANGWVIQAAGLP